MLVYSIWILTATKFVQIGIPALDFLPSYTKTGFASLYIYSNADDVYLGLFKFVFEPLGNSSDSSRKKIFREIV